MARPFDKKNPAKTIPKIDSLEFGHPYDERFALTHELAALRKRTREILRSYDELAFMAWLRDEHKVSWQQLAAFFGISVDTARNRMSRWNDMVKAATVAERDEGAGEQPTPSDS